MILRKIEKLMRWIKTRYKSLSFIQQRNNREKKLIFERFLHNIW